MKNNMMKHLVANTIQVQCAVLERYENPFGHCARSSQAAYYWMGLVSKAGRVLIKQYELVSGKKWITTRYTIRKDFLKFIETATISHELQ